MPRSNSVRHLDDKEWRESIEFLFGLDLPGLKVKCPTCGQMGLPGPKWVNGPKTKPVYVFHKNGHHGGAQLDMCLIAHDNVPAIREAVHLGSKDIARLVERAKPFVLFSGGRDSLCAIDYISTCANKAGKTVTALHVDTTAGMPQVTEYVKGVCTKLGIDLEVVRPKVDYFTMAKNWGIPSNNSRWCCRELKIRPLVEFLDSIREPKVVFDGIRAAESGIRAKYLPVWFHPSFNCLSVSAIFGWSDSDVAEYINRRHLPPGLSAELNTSGECWCGAYKRKEDFVRLYSLDPTIFNKLCDVERANKNGFTYIYEHGQKLSLPELVRQIQDGLIACPE